MKRGLLLGIAIGDAVGVPYEFKKRSSMDKNPATDMIGNGSHNQPVGTWSDDSSFAFCLAESIGEGFDLEKLADKFVRWKYNNYMVAGTKLFDIGTTTSISIQNLKNRKQNKMRPENCGLTDIDSNGNGSVMRILPLAHYIIAMYQKKEGMFDTHMKRYELVKKVSGMTHGHDISVMSCHILIEFAINIIRKGDIISIKKIWHQTRSAYNIFIEKQKYFFNADYLRLFHKLLSPDFPDTPREKINSSGFALHTLEASVWCLLNTDNYKDAVLKAVNLGNDTDTTGAVTGGLAGLLYGEEGIPVEWKEKILKKDLIDRLETQMLKI